MNRLTLDGLETRPSQIWGGVRLVPLVRDEPIESLRLHPDALPAEGPDIEDMTRCCYVPHGLTAEWTDDGTVVPAYGTALRMSANTKRKSRRPKSRFEHRTRIRFVPHQIALDAYLPLTYQTPNFAWPEWSARAFNRGLPPLLEPQHPGETVAGLQDALRVFEIHPRQCGVLVYVAEALAGAFVTPHPDDYRVLHPTLIEDSFGELIWRYAHLHPETPDFQVHFDAAAVASLADLRAQAATSRAEWARFHDGTMAAGLLDAEYRFTETYWMHPYTLWRLRPTFESHREAHIGEAITDADGRLAYLHTFRLSETQIRKGRLLQYLADNHWDLEATAAAMGLAAPALVARIDMAGFGTMLRQDVLDHYRALNIRFR